MNTSSHQGFTLIELMIIVAIIGILSTIALPAYQAYTDRARISEVIVVASAAKTNITEYFMSAGHMPDSPDQADVNTSVSQSDYISAINFSTTTTTATITYTLAHTTAVGDIALVGTADSNGMQWQCNTAATTVDDRYLPVTCRH